MANNQFINLEELSKTTQALLSKINEQSNLKVNKANVSAEYSEGTKIAEIEDVEIYAPEIDTSNLATYDDLDGLYSLATDYNNLINRPSLATVATSGSYNDLTNKPAIDNFISQNNYPIMFIDNGDGTTSPYEVKYFSTGNLSNIIDSSDYENDTVNVLFYLKKTIHLNTTQTTLSVKINNYTIDLRVLKNNWKAKELNEVCSIYPGFHYGYLNFRNSPPSGSIISTSITNSYTVSGYTVASNVPADAVFTDTVYDDTAISSRITTLENAGYITSYTETDPTVPEWAKAQTKPSYTATEVGALPSSTTFVSSFNGNTGDITYTAPVTSVNGNTGTVIVDKLKLAASQNVTNYTVLGYNRTGSDENPQYIRDLSRLQFIQYTSNYARLILGDNKTPGVIRLYDNKANTGGYLDLKPTVQTTATREINFPDASGTVALTTDIPSVPSWALANNKPSYTFSELTSHPTTLNDYGITDAYTKTEVDGLVSGVLHYKGAKSTTSALPSSGNVTGDVWHITADGSEWAWDGSTWQELGTAVDLTGYLQSSDIAAWAKAANKPSYTASEVGALPSSTTYVSSFNGQSGAITYVPPVSSVNGQTGVVELTIPSDTSDLTNGAGFLTSFTETDPTVPSWAKASTKPSYTASEVGAASATHAHGSITSDGAITENTALASSDRLVFADNSDSGKLKRSTITFGSSTTQYLANNGTWQNVPSTYDDTALAARVSALEQIPWVTYYTGSTTPSNSQGNNGDLYFQTAQ